MLGVDKCQNCLPKTFTNLTGQHSCLDCPLGKTSESGATVCGLCDAGQFMLNQVCKSCPSGWSSAYGKSLCDECTQGKHVNAEATSCDLCDMGMHGAPNLNAEDRTSAGVACVNCPIGRYSSATGVGKIDLCKSFFCFLLLVLIC